MITMNKTFDNVLTILLTLSIVSLCSPILCSADEMSRINGMGGTRIATNAWDAGIFGNPASLGQVQTHNFAAGITTENLTMV